MGLRKTIGPRKISKFIEELVRPHVIQPDLESAYAEMAQRQEEGEGSSGVGGGYFQGHSP